MAVVKIADEIGFSHKSYYYHFDKGSGVSETETNGHNWLAKDYAGYATYWGFSANAIYKKKVNSAILRVKSSDSRYEDKYAISFNVACKTIDTSSEDKNLVKREDYKKFKKYSSTFKLPAGASQTVDIDITNVLQYAADNFNTAWGLYFIGGVITGEFNDGNIGHVGSKGVMIGNPQIITLKLGSPMFYGVDGAWKECEVYYGENGVWQQVSPHYGVDGVWMPM
jgi:hypothetical protein